MDDIKQAIIALFPCFLSKENKGKNTVGMNQLVRNCGPN